MVTIIGVFVALLLVLVTLLALPLTLYFNITWPQTSKNAVTVRWLFGLIRVRLPIQGIGSRSTWKRKAKHQSANNSRGRKRGMTSRANGQQRELVATLLRFARRFWQTIEKNDVCVWLRIGLGDPADTGILLGAVWPLAIVFLIPEGISVELVPEFIEPVFELNTSGSLRFVPLQLTALIVGVIATPAVWRSFR